ncbi:hypothetical protein OSC27_05685 [Microbacterium sp. STN6]|uniref:hypothetical protein n=1 Tax=Microbacterium sp. STN6 TaxID=2995588 RepID=UPI002260C34D|nr:hypothetical protein [Microbacterium sp. STN6]MCX7521769.1 hypothetical protein [Microbacterium sp. STN6]
MSMISAEQAAQIPLETDDEILQRARDIVGRACRRQVWIFMLDEHACQIPVLIPFEDYPAAPEGTIDLFVGLVAGAMSQVEAASVFFVWERRLGEASVPGDRRWAAALAKECRERGLVLRGQLLSHRTGLRWFPPEEYE